MATIRKRGLYSWQVQIRREGWPSQTKTFELRDDAVKWARRVEREMDRGAFESTAEAEKTTVGEVIDRYLIEVTPLKKSAQNERQRLLFIKSALGKHNFAALHSKHIAAFRDKRLKEEKAAATVIKELNSLSHVIDTAIKDWGIHIPANPVKLVRRPSAARGRDRRLLLEEEIYLLSACEASKSPALAVVVRLALETGMRLGELLKLDWRHVDLQRPIVYLPDTKSGDDRTVPLSKKAVEILRLWPQSIDGRVFPQWKKADSFEHAWRRAVQRARKSYLEECKEAGRKPVAGFLEDFRFHDLRHEATSRFFEKDLNLMEVATITGHKTLQMLKRYTHLKADDLAKKLG